MHIGVGIATAIYLWPCVCVVVCVSVYMARRHTHTHAHIAKYMRTMYTYEINIWNFTALCVHTHESTHELLAVPNEKRMNFSLNLSRSNSWRSCSSFLAINSSDVSVKGLLFKLYLSVAGLYFKIDRTVCSYQVGQPWYTKKNGNYFCNEYSASKSFFSDDCKLNCVETMIIAKDSRLTPFILNGQEFTIYIRFVGWMTFGEKQSLVNINDWNRIHGTLFQFDHNWFQ